MTYGKGPVKRSCTDLGRAHAFSRHLPDGDVGKSRRSREEIRLRYTNAGRPYDLAITLSPYEAHRYVKPAQAGQPPVNWWRKQADG